jgi:hypothetical protein
MKASSVTVFTLGVLAILALGACGSEGMQSQSPLASSQARSQTSTPNIRHMTSGRQKVGQFWWVTNVVSVAPGPPRKTIDAVCPTAFVPTGGGISKRHRAIQILSSCMVPARSIRVPRSLGRLSSKMSSRRPLAVFRWKSMPFVRKRRKRSEAVAPGIFLESEGRTVLPLGFLVEMRGLEPLTPCLQSRLRPSSTIAKIIRNGVAIWVSRNRRFR